MAVDYVDRYLSTQRNIPKTRLQLVGVTALFVAAKNEVSSQPFMLIKFTRKYKRKFKIIKKNFIYLKYIFDNSSLIFFF